VIFIHRYLLMSLTMKKLRKSVNICQSYEHDYNMFLYFTHELQQPTFSW